MNTHTTLTAAPAPQQAPNYPGGATGAGSTAVAGMLVAVWLISKWKKEITGDTRKYVLLAVLATACLTIGGGIAAQMLNTAATTAGTISGTVTGTVTGQ
jgi:cytochrome bd-type quinol oxidase subunit 2